MTEKVFKISADSIVKPMGNEDLAQNRYKPLLSGDSVLSKSLIKHC